MGGIQCREKYLKTISMHFWTNYCIEKRYRNLPFLLCYILTTWYWIFIHYYNIIITYNYSQGIVFSWCLFVMENEWCCSLLWNKSFYIELMNPYTDDDALNFLECPLGVICLVNWFIVRITMEQYLTILKIFFVLTAQIDYIFPMKHY